MGTVAIVTVLWSGWAGTATADGVELEPDRDSFEETFDPSVDVSGQLLAGLMYTVDAPDEDRPELGRVDLDELHVSFARHRVADKDTICFRLASRNGVYTAKWTSTPDSSVVDSDTVRVRFTTKHRKTLQEYGPHGLVALASVGEGCGTPDPVYLPTSWGPVPEEGPSEVTLFLNTDTAEARVAARLEKEDGSDDGIKQESCTILPSTETTTTFDTICRLPLAAGDRPAELAVLRQNFSATLEPLRYTLTPPR